MANADSGLEELAGRLAEALGAAQFPPSEPTAALAELVAEQEPGARSQETEGTGSASQIEQLLAGGGTSGSAGDGIVNAPDSFTAQIGQILAGSGTAGSAGAVSSSTADSTAPLTAAVEELRLIAHVQVGTADQNSSTISSSSQSNSGGSSTLNTIGSVAASVFENGLGLGPLISGLGSLFGGNGGSTAPPPFSSYTAPESVRFEGDVYRGANSTDWGGSGGTQTGAPLPTSTQITVQVNAIDSQSFLDHSQDIANAVRQAMLNSNSLNDVVSDL